MAARANAYGPASRVPRDLVGVQGSAWFDGGFIRAHPLRSVRNLLVPKAVAVVLRELDEQLETARLAPTVDAKVAVERQNSTGPEPIRQVNETSVR